MLRTQSYDFTVILALAGAKVLPRDRGKLAPATASFMPDTELALAGARGMLFGVKGFKVWGLGFRF